MHALNAARVSVQISSGIMTNSNRVPYPHHNVTGQRQHLNPYARLRPWEDPVHPAFLQCYDKLRRRGPATYRQPMASATVARDVWPADTETQLSKIESVANPVFERLLCEPQPHLENADRWAVALCICSLWRRGRAWLSKQPNRISREVESLVDEVRTASVLTPEQQCIVEDEANKLAATPPGRPLPLVLPTRAIALMRWTVLCNSRERFLTGDTPVTITPNGCLISPRTELVLPLGPCKALLCDWTRPLSSTSVEEATPKSVRDLNRRVAQAAVQRVYSNTRIDRKRMAKLLVDRRPYNTIHHRQAAHVPGVVTRDFGRIVRNFRRHQTNANRSFIADLLADSM